MTAFSTLHNRFGSCCVEDDGINAFYFARIRYRKPLVSWALRPGHSKTEAVFASSATLHQAVAVIDGKRHRVGVCAGRQTSNMVIAQRIQVNALRAAFALGVSGLVVARRPRSRLASKPSLPESCGDAFDGFRVRLWCSHLGGGGDFACHTHKPVLTKFLKRRLGSCAGWHQSRVPDNGRQLVGWHFPDADWMQQIFAHWDFHEKPTIFFRRHVVWT